MVTEGRHGLQDVEGNKSYLVKAVATVPPPLRGLNDLQDKNHTLVSALMGHATHAFIFAGSFQFLGYATGKTAATEHNTIPHQPTL